VDDDPLPEPWLIENMRRSIAVGREGLDRPTALRVLRWLVRALDELRRLRDR